MDALDQNLSGFFLGGTSWRISPGHFLKVFHIGATILSLSAKAAFMVEVFMAAALLLSVCHNQHRDSLRTIGHLYQSNEVVLFLNVMPELYADQGKMSDCGCQALLPLPLSRACIIDDSSCQDKFLSTKFILIAVFAYQTNHCCCFFIPVYFNSQNHRSTKQISLILL